jgi:isoquinoline 1-oxidoreductase subunit alpha
MLSLNINGRQVLVKSDPATPLLWVLRHVSAHPGGHP